MTALMGEAHMGEMRRIQAMMNADLDAAMARPREIGRFTVKQRFVQRFGHIPYTRVMSKPPHWRAGYAAGATCELGCGAAGNHGDVLVFDHCHNHGWVRGVVCNSCNVRLGRLESVMALPGVRVDLGESPWAKFLAGCPGCKGAGDAA